jgi:hypothetical protein
MNTVGIDLHRKRSVVAVVDEQGEVSAPRRLANERGAILELLGELDGETQVAVEANLWVGMARGAARGRRL